MDANQHFYTDTGDSVQPCIPSEVKDIATWEASLAPKVDTKTKH